MPERICGLELAEVVLCPAPVAQLKTSLNAPLVLMVCSLLEDIVLNAQPTVLPAVVQHAKPVFLGTDQTLLEFACLAVNFLVPHVLTINLKSASLASNTLSSVEIHVFWILPAMPLPVVLTADKDLVITY